MCFLPLLYLRDVTNILINYVLHYTYNKPQTKKRLIMAGHRAGFIAAFLAVAVLAFVVVRPLMTTLLGACVLAYLFYPVHKRLRRFLHSDSLSAMAVTVLIILLIVIPAFFVINALTREVIGLVASSSQQECGKNAVCSALGYLKGINPGLPESLRNMISSLAGALAKYVAIQASAILLSLSGTLFHLSVLFFITFYLLKDGAEISGRVMKLLPLGSAHKKEIAERVGSITYAIVFGTIVVALVQGLAALVGFSLLGVSNPVLWGIVTVFASLIPFLGAFAVWFPAALIMGANGYLQGDSTMVFRAFVLFAYGALIISTIDNWLKPKLIGDTARIHPVLVILGVFGGLAVFGLVGLIVGPLILSLFAVFVEIAKKERVV